MSNASAVEVARNGGSSATNNFQLPLDSMKSARKLP
jgi:hypothetical protein